MSEPTTYALPDEPEGPVWDSLGKRWTPTDVDGWWIRDVTGGQCTWAYVLEVYGPLTSTPPWEPEVGGTVETEEQYAAMPVGSIIASSSYAFQRTYAGEWLATGLRVAYSDEELAGISRTILRVGWSL